MTKLTKEQKVTLRAAEKAFDKIAADWNVSTAKWAFNKVMQGLTEKQKLMKEKSRIEARLNEIEKEL